MGNEPTSTASGVAWSWLPEEDRDMLEQLHPAADSPSVGAAPAAVDLVELWQSDDPDVPGLPAGLPESIAAFCRRVCERESERARRLQAQLDDEWVRLLALPVHDLRRLCTAIGARLVAAALLDLPAAALREHLEPCGRDGAAEVARATHDLPAGAPVQLEPVRAALARAARTRRGGACLYLVGRQALAGLYQQLPETSRDLLAGAGGGALGRSNLLAVLHATPPLELAADGWLRAVWRAAYQALGLDDLGGAR